MKHPSSILKPLLVVLLCSISFVSFSQNPTDDDLPDPGALSVSTLQNLKFGAFYIGASGGTVIVSSTGSRSVTGDLVPLNLGLLYCQAIFEIEAPEGSIISILNGPDATLTGSNGGSLNLHLNSSDPLSPFNSMVTPPGRTSVNIGGTITVGDQATAVPGSYTGTFYITFNNE